MKYTFKLSILKINSLNFQFLRNWSIFPISNSFVQFNFENITPKLNFDRRNPKKKKYLAYKIKGDENHLQGNQLSSYPTIMVNMHRLVPVLCVMITVLGSGGISHEDGPIIIGAITDNSSRIGKEQRVALKMALDDFFQHTNRSFVLHTRDSHGDPHHAALAGLSSFLFHCCVIIQIGL